MDLWGWLEGKRRKYRVKSRDWHYLDRMKWRGQPWRFWCRCWLPLNLEWFWSCCFFLVWGHGIGFSGLYENEGALSCMDLFSWMYFMSQITVPGYLSYLSPSGGTYCKRLDFNSHLFRSPLGQFLKRLLLKSTSNFWVHSNIDFFIFHVFDSRKSFRNQSESSTVCRNDYKLTARLWLELFMYQADKL